MIKKLYFEDENNGTKYVLIKDGNIYKLGRYSGDVRIFLYEYRSNTLPDLLKQYPFIKSAAKNMQFCEELDKLLEQTTINDVVAVQKTSSKQTKNT